MIRVQRLNGEEMFINPDLVRAVSQRPDTVLTFLDGSTLTILGLAEEFIKKWTEHRNQFPRLNPGEPQWK